MAELLQSLSPQQLPLLPHILGPRPGAGGSSAAAAAAAAEGAGAAPKPGGFRLPLMAAEGPGACTPEGSPRGSAAQGFASNGLRSPSPCYSPSDSEASREGGSGMAGTSSSSDFLQCEEGAEEGGGSDFESEAEPPQRKRPKRGDVASASVPASRRRKGRGKGAAAAAAAAAAGGEGGEEAAPAEDAEELIARFRLNEEQAAVVRQVAGWCGNSGGVEAQVRLSAFWPFVHAA